MTSEILPSTALLSPVWTHLTHIHPVKGEGIYLYDAAGNTYMDFTSGIGVLNTGHCHPKIVQVIQAQAQNLIFGQMNCVIPPASVALAERLNEITPPTINRFFFSNSGAEATEAAVKLAKAATGRQHVIVFQGSFHGRTHLAMAMTTSKTAYRHRYQPLPAGVFVSPFPYAYHYSWGEEKTLDFCKQQLLHLLHSQTAPDETAAIIIEPILGEGGYVPAPPAFLQFLREVCDQYGILLILDEVQCGFGRSGKMFCFEHADVLPDIMVMAKGLGSGLPISGIGASQELMDKWTPGTHGGTYGGGSAIASAAAWATIGVIQEEGLDENAAERGGQLMVGLRRLKAQYPEIGEVRGRGLMVATEFSHSDGTPDPETASRVVKACLDKQLLLLMCGTYKNVIRWIPPLVVNEEQITEALHRFEEALGEG